jgi:hypothetical protein
MPLEGDLLFTFENVHEAGVATCENCSHGSIPKAPVHDSTASYQHASTASNWSTNQEPLCSALRQLDVESESKLGGSAQQTEPGAGNAQQPTVQAPQQQYATAGAGADLVPVYVSVVPCYMVPNSHVQERRIVSMLNNRSMTYSEMCNGLQELQMDPWQLLQYWETCKVGSLDSDVVDLVPEKKMQAAGRNRSRSKTSRVPGHHKCSHSKEHTGRTQYHQSSKTPTMEELKNRVSKREQGLANVLESKFYEEVERALGKAQLPLEPQAPNLENVNSMSKKMWEDQLHGFRDNIRKKYAALKLAKEGFDRISAEATWQTVMQEHDGQKKPSMKTEDGEAGPDKVEQLWDKFMEIARGKLRMQQLREMGFTNEAAMKRALERSAGDVGIAVAILSKKVQRRVPSQ